MQRLNPSTFCLLTFQSSPNLLAGRSIIRVLLMRAHVGFNPHPTYRLGAATGTVAMMQSKFQSSPNLSGGCSEPHMSWHYRPVVSILTQPLGWVQAGGKPSCDNPLTFQSSLNLSDGCSPGSTMAARWLGRFNPHPTSWLGVASRTGYFGVCYPVSILTQPLGWVQLRYTPASNSSSGVSILTQPLGWVQLNYRRQGVLPVLVSILTQSLGWA